MNVLTRNPASDELRQKIRDEEMNASRVPFRTLQDQTDLVAFTEIRGELKSIQKRLEAMSDSSSRLCYDADEMLQFVDKVFDDGEYPEFKAMMEEVKS